jgi:hypothetical protein
MFWPWNKPGPDADSERKLAALRIDMDDLKADHKRIRGEWEDIFERLTRREDRVRKREERERDRNGGEPGRDKKGQLWAKLRGGQL